MANQIMSYTREPINNVLYDPRLAYSMHLAYSEDGTSYKALNHNSGVLFALATENEDGSLNPMSLENPWIFEMKDGRFGVVATRILGDGGADESSKGSILFWTSEDLLIYEEVGLLPLGENTICKSACEYDKKTDSYHLYFEEETGESFLVCTKELKPGDDSLCAQKTKTTAFLDAGIKDADISQMEGATAHNVIKVSDAVWERLMKKLLTPHNVGISVPKEVKVSSKEEADKIKATALYSDGTTVDKCVKWELDGVDFSKSGTYEVNGTVLQEHFEFPVAFNRADPCIGRWNDKYYFIATNDADNNHTLYVREADCITDLVDAKEHLILDSSTYEGIGGLLWAPEFHIVNGKMYIFHAATPGEFFWEESHIMELKEGGNPSHREDWSAPKRIVKKDGSDLCEAGKTISLDMTCFEWEGSWYVIWSQREFLPKDLGAWLYIAKLNPDKPWELLTDPVVLSKPDYGWGNNHTFVEEGPFALVSGGKLYVTFSAAAVDTSYVVSYLVIEPGKDLLVPKNWRKNNYPILTSRSVEGEYGTGHNAYVMDDNGTLWNTYHARPGTEGVRSSGIRRVHFDIDGAPMLDVTEELDLKPENKSVTTRLIVK